MVEFSSGGPFRPVQFDLTSGIRLLQEQDRINLERQKLQLEQQQTQFNQETDMEFRAAKLRDMAATSTLKEQTAGLNTQQSEYFKLLNGALSGIAEGLAENPGVGGFAASANALPKIQGAAGPQLNRARGAPEGGGLDALRQPYSNTIKSALTQGDPEYTDAVLGYSEHAGVVGSFADDRDVSAASRNVEADLDRSKRGIANLPGSDKMTAMIGMLPFEELFSTLESVQAGIGDHVAGLLTRKVYGDDRFSDKRDQALLAADDKLLDLSRFQEKAAAGAANVSDPSSGAITAVDREGTEMIMGGVIENVLNGSNPSQAVVQLGDMIRNSKVFPESATAVFDQAALSHDPRGLVRASMVYDTLQSLPAREASKMNESILKHPGLYEQIKRMSSVRRSRVADEIKLFGMQPPNPDGSTTLADAIHPQTRESAEFNDLFSLYSQSAADAVDNSLRNTQGFLSAEQANLRGEGKASVDVVGESKGLQRVNEMTSMLSRGEDPLLKDIAKKLGIEVKDIPIEMREDFAFQLANFSPEMASSVSPESRREIATTETLKSWHKEWLPGKRDSKITSFHPVEFAYAADLDDMPAEVAGEMALHQLRTDVLADLKTTEGESARARPEDVTMVPAMFEDQDGRTKRGYIVSVAGKRVGQWAPSFEQEDLDSYYEAVKLGSQARLARAAGLGAGGVPVDDLPPGDQQQFLKISRYLGDNAPDRRKARADRLVSDKRKFLEDKNRDREQIRSKSVRRHAPSRRGDI